MPKSFKQHLPDSSRSCGVWNVPAERTTSFLAGTLYVFPPLTNSTAVAVYGSALPSRTILVAWAPVRTMRFGREALGV